MLSKCTAKFASGAADAALNPCSLLIQYPAASYSVWILLDSKGSYEVPAKYHASRHRVDYMDGSLRDGEEPRHRSCTGIVFLSFMQLELCFMPHTRSYNTACWIGDLKTEWSTTA